MVRVENDCSSIGQFAPLSPVELKRTWHQMFRNKSCLYFVLQHRKPNDLRDCASGGSCKQAKSGHNIIYCYNQIYELRVREFSVLQFNGLNDRVF